MTIKGRKGRWLVDSVCLWGLSVRKAIGYSAANTSHVAFIGWGWAYDGKNANSQVPPTTGTDKMFGYQIALVDTGTYAETVAARTNQAVLCSISDDCRQDHVEFRSGGPLSGR